MSFFYDLNKKLDSIRATPEVTHQQLNERDMSRAAKGYEKYGKQGMEALAKAGREGKSLDPVRKKYNKYNNEDVDEGVVSTAKTIYNVGKNLGKQAASGINKMIGHGSDEELLGTLKKDVGVIREPTTSKRPPRDPNGEDNEIIRPNDPRAKQANDYFDKEVKPGMQSTSKRPPRDPNGEDNEIIRPNDPRAKQANDYFDKQVKEAGKKLNFADKIANAKKEVDEMLGDVAAEAMRSALSPKQKKMAALGGDPKRIDGPDLAALRKGADMDEERSKGTAFDMSTPRASTPRVGSIERGAKHDIKHTATGRMVTRRTDDQGNSVGADDDSEASGEKRGRGRPKGTKQSIGAKGPSGKSKLMTREGDQDITDQGEYDQEGDMAKDDIKTIVRHAQALSKVLGDNDNLPEWVQSKLAKIEGMMISIDEYMQNQADDMDDEKMQEASNAFTQSAPYPSFKKKKPASKEVASTMKPKDTADFASTKHKGLPEKAKKKEVDETSEDGRLTTTRTGPGKTLTTSTTGRVNATIDNGKMSVKPGKPDKQMDDDTDTASSKDTSSTKSNSMVGKGIYDSMNHELELMIAESMSINMSDSTEGNKSLTITATDEDAMKLAMMLKAAGLGGHGGDMHSHSEEPCDTCGMQDCGCGDVQEAVDDNAPDYPTNTEQANNNFGYAGGLNKPKTDVAGDGQSTVPVTAVHTQEEDALRRMMEMAGIKTEDPIDLGPASPEVTRMSRDEVNAALRSGMSPAVDLGPASPEVTRMSRDEVNAALRSGMSPDMSNMDPDSINAEFYKDDSQYEDSIQRMREMAGIQEAKKDIDQNNDGKNDFEDIKIARMKASGAIKDKEEKKVDESIFALTNQWKAYKG